MRNAPLMSKRAAVRESMAVEINAFTSIYILFIFPDLYPVDARKQGEREGKYGRWIARLNLRPFSRVAPGCGLGGPLYFFTTFRLKNMWLPVIGNGEPRWFHGVGQPPHIWNQAGSKERLKLGRGEGKSKMGGGLQPRATRVLIPSGVE
jgi:hypothetical protein